MKTFKVLVAENDSRVLFALGKVLENEGFVCIPSSSIEQALTKIARSDPQAVFLDVSRSVGDYNTIDKIKKINLTLPLVIISSHITEDVKKLAETVGALQVIEKPLSLESVRRCLDRIKAKIIEK